MLTPSNDEQPSPNFSSVVTIRDREEQMERALDALRSTSENTAPATALQIVAELRSLFAPAGYRSTIQLEEDGRKKRATAAASNWKFSNGEIVIFTEPVKNAQVTSMEPSLPRSGFVSPQEPATVTEDDVRQCCEALAEAEKSGRQFVGLKLFRDSALATLRYPWAATAEGRARVLKEAMDRGAIETRKIPNPKAPMHPTTTVRLVPREQSPVKLPSRFNPVPIMGEPASVTLLRDRGSY